MLYIEARSEGVDERKWEGRLEENSYTTSMFFEMCIGAVSAKAVKMRGITECRGERRGEKSFCKKQQVKIIIEEVFKD